MRTTLPRAAWLAVGAIAGALLLGEGATALPLAPLPAAGLGLLLLAFGIAAAAFGRATPGALLLGIGTVALRGAMAASLASAGAVGAPLPAGSGGWQATVVDISAPVGPEQRAFVRISDPGATKTTWLVYAWMPRHPALLPGDHVTLRGTLQARPDDGSGFAGFLESRGAVGTLKAHAVELTTAGAGFAAAVERLRWNIDSALSRAIPEPEAGLASGILIGLRERVSRAVADDFTVTGLTHVVAISGWNIALLASIITALLRAMRLGRRRRSFIVIAAIVGYTILAGAEASVIRAAVMGGVVIVARESGRPSGAAAALGLACWGLLLLEPAMIDDVGLQLSLAAAAGLLVLGGHAETAVQHITRGHAPRWFSETLGVSLAAQLSTLPLILLHFGRLSLISPLANLLVAPIVPLAMLGAALGVLLGPLTTVPFLDLLSAPLLLGTWLPLALMTRGAGLLAEVPLANVELIAPFDLVGSVAALLALLAALRATRRQRSTPAERGPGMAPQRAVKAGRRHRLASVGVVVVLATASTVVLIARPLPGLRVSVLDIGQGDSILLEASDGSRLLVDGGPDPDLLVRRLDERIPVWDRRIDLALLTHPHEDHAGGLAGLVPRYRLGRIVETGMRSDGAGIRQLRAVASRYRIARSRLVQGDQLRLGEARISVLWPPREAIPAVAPSSGRGVNDTSIVLGVSIGRQRILLMGDLEDDRDEDLLEVLPHDGQRWDLLKVAHHGSATASSQPLLEVLRPRLAAISVGEDNPYGHPAPTTLQRLADVGARIWRTDRDGTLSVTFDGRPRSAAALLVGPEALAPCPAAGRRMPFDQADGHDACYARPDGGPHPNRSTHIAHVYRALATVAAAHDRGRRSGRLPGLSRDASGHLAGSPPGRNGRAPPRHRQGPAARASSAGARARPGRCRLAQRGRSPGAGPDGGSAPGEPAQ